LDQITVENTHAFPLGRNGKDIADGLLSACMPELENLASHLSKYHHQAASLVVEAKSEKALKRTGNK
jgi:hypothetical protein